MLVPPDKQLSKKELEAKVSSDISDFMKKKGWRKLRQQSAMVSRLVAGVPDPQQVFRIGEKGMTDLMFIYYLDQSKGLTVTVWVEVKRSKGGVLGEDQIEWQTKEIERGALVINASNVQEYIETYVKVLGWIHDSAAVKGQASLFQ